MFDLNIPSELLERSCRLLLDINSVYTILYNYLENIPEYEMDHIVYNICLLYIYNKTLHGYGYISPEYIHSLFVKVGVNFRVQVFEEIIDNCFIELDYLLSDRVINPWGMYYVEVSLETLHLNYVVDYRILKWNESKDAEQYSECTSKYKSYPGL